MKGQKYWVHVKNRVKNQVNLKRGGIKIVEHDVIYTTGSWYWEYPCGPD